MALPAEPPKYDSFRDIVAPLKQGTTGWPAYAVQVVVGADPDGVWGPMTDQSVRGYQSDNRLAADGIVGPATQQFILNDLGAKADLAHGLPVGVGFGFASAEGGGVLAATNWSVGGGVDCGPAQWRVAGPPFNPTDMKYAFDARKALDGAVGRLVTIRKDYRARNVHLTKDQALRLAILRHNWPAGAEAVVKHFPGGKEWWRWVPEPDKRAPAGGVWPPEPFTRAEWAREYPKRILRYVV